MRPSTHRYASYEPTGAAQHRQAPGAVYGHEHLCPGDRDMMRSFAYRCAREHATPTQIHSEDDAPAVI